MTFSSYEQTFLKLLTEQASISNSQDAFLFSTVNSHQGNVYYEQIQALVGQKNPALANLATCQEDCHYRILRLEFEPEAFLLNDVTEFLIAMFYLFKQTDIAKRLKTGEFDYLIAWYNVILLPTDYNQSNLETSFIEDVVTEPFILENPNASAEHLDDFDLFKHTFQSQVENFLESCSNKDYFVVILDFKVLFGNSANNLPVIGKKFKIRSK